MLTIFSAFIVSLVTGFFVLRYQEKHQSVTGDLDLVGIQKFHTTVVPRIGGALVFLGIISGILIRYFSPDDKAFNVGVILTFAALPAFIGGFIEDLTKKVGVKTRLFLTSLSAGLAGFWLNAWLTDIQIVGLDFFLAIPIISVVFTCFAVAGVANSFNLIDGFNGLASIVSLMILFSIAYVAYQVRDYGILLSSFAAIGAIAGFVFWNYPKGSIFLGDGGAYLIGFWIAELCVLLVTRNPSVSKWFPVLICIYPIFETIFTIYRRLVKRLHPGMPDANHLHQMIFRRVVCDPTSENEEDLLRENSRTSPYLWVLTSLAIMPAILFWQSKVLLQLSTLLFCITYLWLYWAIVRFKTPGWLGR
ncbi:glycosyltransferase [Polynucleobacter sp. UK-Kesae-W10]|uniref:MraY family glycosyltransferase n=1 Tax=Polynucleobacter sp. UK-Kesae-W10 TaxID=1819738 RepID=UPI001C0B2338|nr:glycosyltransferase [Polynucleobacter sp. UK-Kesae-W10]MBU3576947.1 glycosyltransferase family 4 protein [Polynucleobacter sp. UK-Kesae-W10]